MGLVHIAAAGGVAGARYLLNVCKVKVNIPWPCHLSWILIKSKPRGGERQNGNFKCYLLRAEVPLVYREKLSENLVADSLGAAHDLPLGQAAHLS